MDRYIDGILTGYNRVMNYIDSLDPEHKDKVLDIVRLRIDSSVEGYRLFIKEKNYADLSDEAQNILKLSPEERKKNNCIFFKKHKGD